MVSSWKKKESYKVFHKWCILKFAMHLPEHFQCSYFTCIMIKSLFSGVKPHLVIPFWPNNVRKFEIFPGIVVLNIQTICSSNKIQLMYMWCFMMLVWLPTWCVCDALMMCMCCSHDVCDGDTSNKIFSCFVWYDLFSLLSIVFTLY